MAPSLEVAALRRLARVYRRILVVAVPAALAGCQGGGDVFAPTSADLPADVGTPVVEVGTSPDFLAAASLDRIAYTSYVDPSGADIWTMTPAGGGQIHLTVIAGEESHAAWSPDHTRIAYSRVRVAPMRDVFLVNADGSNAHWVLSAPTGYFVTGASWAPDGKSLLAQIWIGTTSSYIVKLDPATGSWSHLAPAGHYAQQGRNPIWSKDGKWIYYASATGYSIRRFQPGGQDVLVKSFPAAPGNLALSPDGTRLAYDMYATTTPGKTEIYTLNLANNTTFRLTYDGHQETDPAWSPDGKRIAFVSDRSGRRQIYVMSSTTGGNVAKITSKPIGADQPSWYR